MIPLLMFAGLFALVFLGVPVGFALVFSAFVAAVTILPPMVAGVQMYNVLIETTTNWLLTAVPPFVLMGFVLERSGIGEAVFAALRVLLDRLRGGTALAAMAMAALFAATTGIVGAVEVLVGIMAIGPLTRQGYGRDLISGVICAGGSLGTMVPPTLVVVIYASVANISIAKLYSAVLLPSAAMIAIFLLYIFVRCHVTGEGREAGARATEPSTGPLRLVVTGILPTFFLIGLVLGTVLTGFASPTEAASLGVVGALILAAINGGLTGAMLVAAMRSTVFISCMVLLIVVGGAMFSAVFRLQGGQGDVAQLIAWLNPGPSGALFLMLVVVFIAGFVLEWVSVVLITTPIFLPLIAGFSIDPLWFATLVVIVLQTSYLTPPMAPSIFYLRSVAPAEFSYSEMYRGVVPFILCQIVILALVIAVPAMTTWLPSQIPAF